MTDLNPFPENAGLSNELRWAVNVLLENIAAKFEANETMDLWRSDAASLVRSFKHDLAALSAPRVEPVDYAAEQQKWIGLLREMWTLITDGMSREDFFAATAVAIHDRVRRPPSQPDTGVREWEPTEAQVNSACLSFRHDFGLLDEVERKVLQFTAKEFLRAWQKEGAAASRIRAMKAAALPPDVGSRKA